MTYKQYKVILDNRKIGVTELEKADAPMGVVSGKLMFENITSGYAFLKGYCKDHAIGYTELPEENAIFTRDIPDLKVVDPSGIEIKGLACSISGMDSGEFEIIIEGVPYPFYEQEFPHHVAAYHNHLQKFK